MKTLCALTFSLLAYFCSAQSFTNGDLDGSINGLSSLPTGWQSIPYTDPVCDASNSPAATPDLISETQPLPASGFIGTPYSGLTFVSGGHSLSTAGNFFHEGIKQTLTGLTIGVDYEISFYQCVHKTAVCRDTSGSWSVYADTTLLGITIPSTSQLPFDALNLNWEMRSIGFTASQTDHVIKFLPMDDDQVHLCSSSDLNGGLVMGIDLISISSASGISDLSDASVKIAPNPTRGRLVVHGPYQPGSNYEIRGIGGHVVQVGNIQDNIIDVTQLSVGIYMLTLRDRKTSVRFVKD